MRRTGTESGLLGFCRKLTRDILQFADPLRPSSGGKLHHALNGPSRSLQIEPLEVRSYLSGTSIAEVDPVWFQEVAGATHDHAGTASWTAEGFSTNNQQTNSTNSASNTYDWIVQFDTQYVSNITNITQTMALLAGGGVQFQAICGLGIVGQVLVRSSGASLDSVEHWLAADEHVASFEEDAVRQIEATPNDTSLSQLWGMSKIDAYGAWNVTTGNSGANRVVVAVIDTGVDYNHADLAANIWNNPNAGRDGFGNDIHGYDFANNDSNPMDDNGHGTHVAGTIGAVGNNGRGVTGVNWAVSIMPLKFMTATGSGYLSDAIRAINYTTMQRTQYGVNVRVINASWGGGGYSAAMQTAIQAAGNAGILFVTAAGNDAANNDVTPHYPAGYNCTNIISVAATDKNDRLASFSCYGATTVDIAAPGVSIYSTLPGNRYGILSGTSMATPHVAGAAALAWAYDPTASIAEIRNALLQGVDHLGTLSGKVVSGGRLDVLQTLQLLHAPSPTAPTIGSLTVSTNNILQGAPVDLNAIGVAAGTGSVTAVYFYQDINGNGVYDTSDLSLGSDNTIVSGAASLRVNTANMTPGTYRFFARVLASNNQFSTVATTTLTISPDNNQNSSSAIAITTGAKLNGKIVTGGKEGWYQFQAVAGTSYTIRTELVTLRDSMLFLYDRDGKTLLTSNDDGDSGLASRINWVAPKSGTYYFKVTGFDKKLTGDFRVSLAANKTGASSAGTANVRSFSTSIDTSMPFGAAVPPADGVYFFQTSNLGNRLFVNSGNFDTSPLSSTRSGLQSIEATSAILSEMTISRNEMIASTADHSENERSISLLDRHPALRSVLSSMFFENESDAAEPMNSMERDLDALDALFAQLSGENFRM
jgi:hypothetical protein